GIEKKYGAKQTAELIDKTIVKVHTQKPNTIIFVLSAWGENKTSRKYNFAVKKETHTHKKNVL
ncbi:hypothetical protein MZO44_16895, partial [Lactiplantibacillus sp. E932]|uniref:hypothetical protein n=1 Tax=Lactiplantibacillus plantarum TaxID=1590 RepID=UPI0020771612